MSPNPSPCCVPTRQRLTQLALSIQSSAARPRATAGSLANMVRLEGRFHMGSESPEAFPTDGEGPVRQVTLTAFYISKYAVTNEQFAEFVRRTGYRTEAQRFGWSFVFRNHVPEPQRGPAMPGTPWWVRVDGADWSHPEGPDTSIAAARIIRPSTYPGMTRRLTAHGPAAACPPKPSGNAPRAAASKGRPTRGADDLTPEGRHMCNIWQGVFPDADLGEDGFTNVAPVDSFPANGFGLSNAVGNTWEWCADYFDPLWHVQATRIDPVGPPSGASRA
jgi:formylglycine-generating enzyme